VLITVPPPILIEASTSKFHGCLKLRQQWRRVRIHGGLRGYEQKNRAGGNKFPPTREEVCLLQ